MPCRRSWVRIPSAASLESPATRQVGSLGGKSSIGGRPWPYDVVAPKVLTERFRVHRSPEMRDHQVSSESIRGVERNSSRFRSTDACAARCALLERDQELSELAVVARGRAARTRATPPNRGSNRDRKDAPAQLGSAILSEVTRVPVLERVAASSSGTSPSASSASCSSRC